MTSAALFTGDMGASPQELMWKPVEGSIVDNGSLHKVWGGACVPAKTGNKHQCQKGTYGSASVADLLVLPNPIYALVVHESHLLQEVCEPSLLQPESGVKGHLQRHLDTAKD